MHAEKQYIISAMPGFDDLLIKEMWKLYSRDGVQNIDPDILKAFYDEFRKRPGLLESMTESRKRNNMKLTEFQLRKRIRKVIMEVNNDRHDYVGPKGIRIGHGNIGGANTDFDSSATRMISNGVWPKMSVHVRNAGDWDWYDCSDHYRFIHTCFACKDEEGRVMFAIYCNDRANSYNATKTDYDCYVLDCNLIEQNTEEFSDPRAHWSNWSQKGEYCVNTQQVCDTLDEALETYEARWVG